MKRGHIRMFLAVAAMLLVSACGGLPGDNKREARELSERIETQLAAVDGREAAYRAAIADDQELRTVAAREQLQRRFPEARTAYGDARRVYDAQVEPILRQNDSASLPALTAALNAVRESLRAADAVAAAPERRLERLREARRNAVEWFIEASRLQAAAQEDHAATRALVERYQGEFPDRRDAIATRFAPGERAMQALNTGAEAVAAQEALRAARQPIDIGLLATGYDAVLANRQAVLENRQILTRDLPTLARAYSKVLMDMREWYYVCVSRTSWNESSYAEREYHYPCVRVSAAALEAAEGFDDYDREFLLMRRAWGGEWHTDLQAISNVVTAQQTSVLWNELGLNPRINWPQNDDSASFWVRELREEYYHRYRFLENGEIRNGEWEQVTLALYDQHYDDLGMAILEKPFGQFEDEAVRTAAPPGMALVGDSRTGEWRSDGNNGLLWFWLGRYSSYNGLYGPGWGGYSQSEWNEYRNHRGRGESFYGSGTRTYGTLGSSTRTGPLAGSDFGRAGGFREAAAEVRSAGPAGRSGGPQSGK